MTRPIWIACGEKPAIYGHRQSPIIVQKHQQRQRKPAMALCINLWLLKTPFFARRPKHHPHSAAFRRRPDIAGPAISLLLGTLRRTQEALAALRIGREAHFNPFSFNPRRPRTKGPDGFPSECIPQHEAPLSAAPKEQDKGASSARTHSEGNPSGPGESHRVIDYPVFCKPAETPVTVERIRLMYSAFFSSAISSWFIRTSRRARTWAMDRAST